MIEKMNRIVSLLAIAGFVALLYAPATLAAPSQDSMSSSAALGSPAVKDSNIASCGNQGVGNGPENCDPGNSNQGNPKPSNDELNGVPGSPGRKGGPGI